MSSFRRAFTLVELLVVLAILSLLVTILLPSLRAAKETARAVCCKTQLRELCLAARYYADDHNGVLPTCANLRRPDEFVEDYLVSHKLLACPSATLRFTSASQRRTYQRRGWYLTYGINHYGRGPRMSNIAWDTMSGRRMSDVANPNVIYMVDADDHRSPHDVGGLSRNKLDWPLRTSFEYEAYIRHSGGYNAVDMQGAVQWHDGLVPNHEEWWIYKDRCRPGDADTGLTNGPGRVGGVPKRPAGGATVAQRCGVGFGRRAGFWPIRVRR